MWLLNLAKLKYIFNLANNDKLTSKSVVWEFLYFLIKHWISELLKSSWTLWTLLVICNCISSVGSLNIFFQHVMLILIMYFI